MPLPLIPVLLGGLAATAIAKKVITPDPIISEMPKSPIPDISNIIIRKIAEEMVEDEDMKKRLVIAENLDKAKNI